MVRGQSENKVMPLKKILWACGTHWDREWHRTFEGFRCRLVDMMDRAIECVQNVPGYGWFLLDGQSIVLTDYLDARPEMRQTLQRLLESEKLFAGPFYVLQDEMVEDGELFVRNLQKGISLAKRFGGRRFVGYSTDSFGHCAQLPQLLRLAGVDSMVFSRAFVGKQQDNIWKGPDGSEVFFVWLPLGNGGGAHKDCQDDGRHIPEDRDEALASFERFVERLKPYIHNPVLLIMDAADHMFADPAGLRLASDFNEKHPDGPRFQFSSLPDAVKEIAASGVPDRVQGEIRMTGKTGDGWLLPGTYSTRMPLKHGLSVLTRRLIALEKLHTLLPFSQTIQGAFDRAWDQLLQNIAHDSICGCHVDDVFIENLARLNTARSITEYLAEKSLRAFCPASATTSKQAAAVFYDPAPDVDFYKPFVLECPYPCIEHPERVDLSADGAEFAVSHVERYPTFLGHLTTYRIRGFYKRRTADSVFDVSLHTDRSRGPIKESASGLALLNFVDSGDAGDTYSYSPPERDQVVCSTGTPRKISTRKLADDLVQMQAEVVLGVPAALSDDRCSRTAEEVDLRISYEVTKDLSSGVTWICGRVHNTARDHRLRIVLPVEASDTYSLAGAPFHVERRPVQIEFDAADFTERPLTDYPFVDYIRCGGLSVYSESNGEYQITQRGIEITLCRCVGWLGRPDLAYRKGQAGPFCEVPLAQLLSTDIPFKFMIAPTLSDAAADYRRREMLSQTATQCVLADTPLSIRASLPVGVQGAELTAMRWLSENRLELRLFNPSPESVAVRLQQRRPFSHLYAADLNHNPIQTGFSYKGSSETTLPMQPFQILNIIAET